MALKKNNHKKQLKNDIKKLFVMVLVTFSLINCTNIPKERLRYDSPIITSNVTHVSYPGTSRSTSSVSDLEYLYRTVYGEGRNQSSKEIRAICQVIYNRYQSGLFGNTYKETVMAYKQFSVWNPGYVERQDLLDGYIEYPHKYKRVKRICNEVIHERSRGIDTSRGLNHYYHPAGMPLKCTKYKKISKKFKRKRLTCKRWRRKVPTWTYNYEVKQKIGAGVFYRKGM